MLALDLTEEAVILCVRGSDGTVEEVARAPLDVSDFSTRIDALRIEALVRDPQKRPVTIWLPESQILGRDYDLTATSRKAALAEAGRRLEAETGYGPGEIAIDVALTPRGAPCPVVAALTQTVREAREYAARWGFVPGPVSTRWHADGFGDQQPRFHLPEPRAAVAGRRILQVAAATLLVLGAGYGGLALYDMSRPVLKSFTIAKVPGQAATPTRLRDVAILAPMANRPVARSVAVQSLPIQRIANLDAERLGGVGIARHGAAITGDSPKVLQQPAAFTGLSIGAISDTPRMVRPDRLSQPASPAQPIRIAQLRHALDRIQLTAKALARPPQRRVEPNFQKVAEAIISPSEASASEALPNGAQIAATASDGATLPVERPEAAKPAAKKPQRRIVAPPEPPATPGAQPPTEEPTQEAFAAIDPDTLKIPLPRPDRADTASAEAPSEPLAAPDRDSAEPSQAAVPEPSEETAPDPDERLAALSSPRPTRRPKNLQAASVELPKRTKAKRITAKPVPTSVRSAARERGLDLASTNLIGVIDANSGRRALVRMPDGKFLKVARGDVLDGWRVNSITREAMRLTRAGQNRTLLLVSR